MWKILQNEFLCFHTYISSLDINDYTVEIWKKSVHGFKFYSEKKHMKNSEKGQKFEQQKNMQIVIDPCENKSLE